MLCTSPASPLTLPPRRPTCTEPFVDDDDDLLAEATQWLLFSVLLAGLLIRLGAPNVDSAYDQKFLSVILIILSLIPFVIVFILLVILVTKSVSQREVTDAQEAIEKADEEAEGHRRRVTTFNSDAPPTSIQNPLHNSVVAQRRADKRKQSRKKKGTMEAAQRTGQLDLGLDDEVPPPTYSQNSTTTQRSTPQPMGIQNHEDL